MQRQILEKQQFQREYFNKTFKGFFVKKVAQIIEQQQEAQKIFHLLDIQTSIKDLFYKSIKRQKLQRAIKQQLLPFIGALKEKINKSETKIKFLKHVIFIQFYVWLLDTQLGTRKTLSTKQFQSIQIILQKLKIESQFEMIGAAQDYFIRVLQQLQSMGRFNFNFKDLVCKIAEKNEFQLSQIEELAILHRQNKSMEDKNLRKQKKLEGQSMIPENSNQGKTSITSIQTPGKSSQNRSAKSSPQHSLGRTVFMSHPIRFRAPQKPGVKIITEYYEKQTDTKQQKVQ